MSHFIVSHDLLLFLLLFATMLPTTIATSNKKNIEDITDMCPYTNYCTKNASKIIDSEERSPCCMPCFCSEFCWARDDCCVDVQTPSPPDLLAYKSAIECVSLMFRFVEGKRRIPSKEMYFSHISMITKCTGPAENHPLSERCQLTDDSHVVDLIPVRSTSTGDVYHNEYCAMCYNVDDYEFFDVNIGPLNYYLTSEDVDWNMIDYMLKRITSTDYFLYTYPSVATRDEVSYCNMEEKSDCDVVSDVADARLQYSRQKCKEKTQGFLSASVDRKLSGPRHEPFYHNVYCFICDVYAVYNDMDALLDILPERCHKFNFTYGTVSGGIDMPVSFTRVASSYEEESHDRSMNTCDDTELLDPYMNVCRPLICPELSLPYTATCIFTGIDDIPRTMSFRVVLSGEQNMYSLMSPETVTRIVYDRFRQLFGAEVTLIMCSIEIGTSDNGDIGDSRDTGDTGDIATADDHLHVYYLSAGFQKRKRYTHTLTTVMYLHKTISTFPISIDVAGLIMNMSLMKGVDARQYQYSDNWQEPHNSCKGAFRVIKIWCPTIELSEHDFRYAVAHGVLPDDFEFNNPSELAVSQTADRQICVSDYLNAWINPTSGSSKHTTFTYCYMYVPFLYIIIA